jgi:hypothetical protein
MAAPVAFLARVLVCLSILICLGNCAGPEAISDTPHDPVPGEATPAPQSGPRPGWAW